MGETEQSLPPLPQKKEGRGGNFENDKLKESLISLGFIESKNRVGGIKSQRERERMKIKNKDN